MNTEDKIWEAFDTHAEYADDHDYTLTFAQFQKAIADLDLPTPTVTSDEIAAMAEDAYPIIEESDFKPEDRSYYEYYESQFFNRITFKEGCNAILNLLNKPHE